VRLIIRDDRSRTSIAHKNIQSLINEDHVDVLLGPYSSHLTKAAADICQGYQRILWNHGGASDEICRPHSHWIVSTLSPASQYLQKLPPWIATNDSASDHYLVLSSSKGMFASHVAAGLRQSICALARPVRLQAAELHDTIDALIRLLNEMTPAVLILIGTFEQEIGFIQTRRESPKSIRTLA